MAKIQFFFDIVCPYAFMASSMIEELAVRCQVSVEWIPVLLGGLYQATKAPQGKDGSATDAMNPAKKAYTFREIMLQSKWRNVSLTIPAKHPIRTLKAVRLLCLVSGKQRKTLARALFNAYWQEGRDVSDLAVLHQIASRFDIPSSYVDDTNSQSSRSRALLRESTQNALDRGVFGVPSFIVDGKLFWGLDRLHFVQAALGDTNVKLYRALAPSPSVSRKVTMFYDFSSPFTFLAFTQIQRIVKQCNAQLEMVPILLGALFREVGTPNLPSSAMAAVKQAYSLEDMQRWAHWWKESLVFPSFFPIRTVTALRVAILNPDMQMIERIFRAAWQQERDIGDKIVLSQVLSEAGCNAEKLLKDAEREDIKAQLRTNTTRAKELGLFGAPSFQVGDILIWGQDRLNLLEDVLCGWTPSSSKL